MNLEYNKFNLAHNNCSYKISFYYWACGNKRKSDLYVILLEVELQMNFLVTIDNHPFWKFVLISQVKGTQFWKGNVIFYNNTYKTDSRVPLERHICDCFLLLFGTHFVCFLLPVSMFVVFAIVLIRYHFSIEQRIELAIM